MKKIKSKVKSSEPTFGEKIEAKVSETVGAIADAFQPKPKAKKKAVKPKAAKLVEKVVTPGLHRITDLLLQLNLAPAKNEARQMLVDSQVKIDKEIIRLDNEVLIDAKGITLEVGKTILKVVSVELPKPEIDAAFSPRVNENYLFNGEFVGVVQSFEPFVVLRHFLRNGVIADEPIKGKSLGDFHIEPIATSEYYKRLGDV